jgi:hypothetical protein
MKKSMLLSAMIWIGTSFTIQAQNKAPYSVDFGKALYKSQTLTLNGKTFKVRAYENIVYIQNPVDTVYQKMNIYIPEEYFTGKSVNGYTVQTAPIFFPNQIGGYMPGGPATALKTGNGGFPGGGMPPASMPAGASPSGTDKGPGNFAGGPPPGGMSGPSGNQPSAVVMALSKGYVVASAGARGRTTKDKDGVYTGKAPAAIVDLKAAIRYLKYNDKQMPGDANKIISNGTSAGGALSALVGATGNNPDYEPYLKALGAANATDDIFAVSAYCPITNLDHADMAYEWQFNGLNTYRAGFPQMSGGAQSGSALTENQIKVSAELKTQFPAYVNSLALKGKNGEILTLDDHGNGSFKDLIKSYVIASAQTALEARTDLSAYQWLTINDGKVTGIDFDAYVRYMNRQKTPPAFDALDLSAGENQLFGTEKIDKQHFTAFGQQNSGITATLADQQEVKLMNPMYYIGDPQTKTARHWRIRHGTYDKDTGLGIPVILGTYLMNKGNDVNLALPWNKPHSGDYDLDELFQWTESICK